MKSCFGYVRVSTLKQGEGVSLDAQKDAIGRFASQNDIKITTWFEEKETAAKSGRPVFNAMLKDLRRGKAAGLVMHKIDRSARNFRDWAKIGDLADEGIDVHFATESLDFRSRGGRLSADIQAVIAADYIRNLKEEVAKGVLGQLKQGLFPLKAPLGYFDNGGGKPKTPDPARRDLIRMTFDLYASGEHSLLSLVKHINEAGLRTNNQRPLSRACLARLLTNPFYCGIIRIKTTGEVYQGVHEPIISAKLFDAAQTARAGKSFKKITKHRHLFRGLFQCSGCGRVMTGEKQKQFVYYRCHTSDCPTTTVRSERLEETVLQRLKLLTLTKSHANSLQRQLKAWTQNRTKPRNTLSIDAALSRVDDRLERLTDALIDRLVDREEFNNRKEKLLLEKADLKKQRQKQQSEQATPHRVTEFLEHVRNLAGTYFFLDPSEKRELIRIATSNRNVVGKNVQLEPSNWLRTLQTSLSVSYCAQSRTTSRTKPLMAYQHIEQLIELVNSPEASKLSEICASVDTAKSLPAD